MENGRVAEEPLLEGDLPEDEEVLLNMNELKSVPAGDVDGAFDEGKGSDGAADLVNLL